LANLGFGFTFPFMASEHKMVRTCYASCLFFLLVTRSHSISCKGAQGIPQYKFMFGRFTAVKLRWPYFDLFRLPS
jgi:hypothetical protein